MPTRPYVHTDTLSSNVWNNMTFRDRQQRLGDLTTDFGSFDLSQLPAGLMQLYQAGNQIEVQNQLLQLNVTRAQQGLQPITLAMVGGASLTAPQIGTTVDRKSTRL